MDSLESRQADSMIRQLNTMESPDAVRRVGVAARKRYEALTGTVTASPKSKPRRSIHKTALIVFVTGSLILMCLPFALTLLGPAGITGMFLTMFMTPEQINATGIIYIVAGLVLIAGFVSFLWFVVKGLSWFYDRIVEERIEYQAESIRRGRR